MHDFGTQLEAILNFGFEPFMINEQFLNISIIFVTDKNIYQEL